MSRRELLLVLAFWTFMAALTIANRLLDVRGDAFRAPVSAGPVILAVAEFSIWALLTPAIFAMAGRLSADRRSLVKRVLFFAAVGILVATVPACAHHLGEPHVGRMDVEEGHLLGALVGERVRETRGRRDERSRVGVHLVRTVRSKRDRELSGEYVEGVGMPLVDVDIGAGLASCVAEPRQREFVALGERAQGLRRLVGHDLALAGE